MTETTTKTPSVRPLVLGPHVTAGIPFKPKFNGATRNTGRSKYEPHVGGGQWTPTVARPVRRPSMTVADRVMSAFAKVRAITWVCERGGNDLVRRVQASLERLRA